MELDLSVLFAVTTGTQMIRAYLKNSILRLTSKLNKVNITVDTKNISVMIQLEIK